ncbi:MAG: CPBP family intramembrane metalloprotease [Lachnospiraceae bacterium]|nr:CPBP family intramembrane metalloprotease [Lachnospiraceae bacterium]
MKKFIMAVLRGLGYFGIFVGMQLVLGGILGIVLNIMISVRYVASGQDMQDPAVAMRFSEELVQLANESSVPLTVVANALSLGVTCLIFVCGKKKITREVSLRKLHPGAIAPLVMMGLGLNVWTSIVMSFIPEEYLESYQQASEFLSTDVGVMTVLLALVAAPVVEEWFLRGLVYTRFKKGMPVIVAMLFSSLLFGVMHGHWLWMIYTAIFGMVLAWVFERTKSLYASILLHFGYNLCSMLMQLLPETAPDWTGLVILATSVVFVALGWFLFVKTPKVEEPEEEFVTEPAMEGTENF